MKPILELYAGTLMEYCSKHFELTIAPFEFDKNGAFVNRDRSKILQHS